jgi:hypothetical protein
MLRLYELPEDVDASAETRLRYAEFAREFYEHVSDDVYTEKRNSQRRNVSEGDWELDLQNITADLEYDLMTNAYIQQSNAIFAHAIRTDRSLVKHLYFIGAYLPNHVIHAYGSYGVFPQINKDIFTHTGAPVLPLDVSLRIARDIEPQHTMQGNTFYPIRFPYTSPTLYYAIHNDGNENYNFHLAFAKSDSYMYKGNAVFYNPIQNRVEDWKGRPLI